MALVNALAKALHVPTPHLQTIYDLRVAERTSARKIEREVAPAEQAAAA
jgi:plasmid maintenance system antidote protein VapI